MIHAKSGTTPEVDTSDSVSKSLARVISGLQVNS